MNDIKSITDVDKLMNFFIDIFKEYKDIYEESIKNKKDLALKQFYDNPDYIIGIKENNKIVAGLFSIFVDETNTIMVEIVAVDKNYRLSGYGSKLLNMLEENAKKNNVNKIILNSKNETQDFYMKNDYKPILYVHVFQNVSLEDFEEYNKYCFKVYNYSNDKFEMDGEMCYSSKIRYYVDAPRKEYINYFDSLYNDSYTNYFFVKELNK